MAILISGVGRSGTTTIFQILGKALLDKYKGNARCVYEPYLWNIPEIECTARLKGQAFNIDQVGLFNQYVHCHTPLFLKDRHALHDYWLRKVFSPYSPNASETADNVLVKVIRGSGRLEAALTRYRDLKVIIITRNIVDTVNSGLGLSSFFGDEFHPSDKARFLLEVHSNFNNKIDSSNFNNEIQWSKLWWHYFTEASIQAYEKFQDRVYLLPYEKYVRKKSEVLHEMLNFVGIDIKYLDSNMIDSAAGLTTAVSHLERKEIKSMSSEMSWYFNRLDNAISFKVPIRPFCNEQAFKYAKRTYRESLIPTEKTGMTGVQWRLKAQIEIDKSNQVSKNKMPPILPLSMLKMQADFGTNDMRLREARMERDSASANLRGSVGVLVTCFNNENSISEAIYSVLNQTKLPEIICVADDNSTDNSIKIVEEIASRHPNINLIRRNSNVGVAANRDLAIRSMDCDYITTLDGDDLFYPEKIELEYLVLADDMEKVAFSDIVIVESDNSFVQDASGYSGESKANILNMLTSRSVPVPRDMMFSKILFERSMGFDVGMQLYEDWALKMRLMIVAGNNCWVHSGGKGTIYDRRSPGLSGKSPIRLAYGQLLALSRNAEMLADYPTALIYGLESTAKLLPGDAQIHVNQFLKKLNMPHDTENLVNRLREFWSSGSFNDDENVKYEHIRILSRSL